MSEIGKPIDRVNGRLNVMGAAKYSAEFNQPQMAYATKIRKSFGAYAAGSNRTL